ncbi:hyaluronan-binding protein 2-like isoform X1 [Acipenser ruthenus]|uniref:hyaluronan-binding protein 2-like isoform X1 n=1 Tax=Acipenser ruthenus TaxID=7906 RepID=UPI0027418A9F|nr:hyaluronan-binding protein 2-like isoform X1 [Acipenser ruthenus]
MAFQAVRLALCITLLRLPSSFAVLRDIVDAYDYVEADYDLHYTYEYDYEPAEPDSIDWLYDLVGTEEGCDPNPCQNNGVCEARRGRYKCHCPEPFSGRNCHKVNGVCKKAKCGKGECVITSTPPYYRCKCRYPFQPPNCKKLRPDPVLEELPKDSPKGPSTAAPSEMFATCGIAEPKAARYRIYGGIKAIPGAHPWQASIQTKHPNNIARHYCGGILIKPCWVLTAAHCVVGTASRVQVVLGGQDLQKNEPEDQTFDVEKSIVHENYRNTGKVLYNDIALLKLKPVGGQCAKETRYVKTACLPDSPFADGTECSISGWGSTETTVISNQLLSAKVLLISQERCKNRNVYGSLLDNSMFCAGNLEGGPDSCQGDSGGPLTCKRDGKHYAYGIVSWGDQCGLKNKPGVYARVTEFVDWINSKVN